ncbi:E3 ubiquitin-protein ligase RNF170-like [Corticium candelabrum]|uniref:E3 ubiquitin-protein ligase RNF170-like n=1 Tax=Corticium candelabrum TaxID=121492 RepID=UPI002E26A010|nr:E3 ubiquitin-protein ligase RNF170-like [Corticium candelabrum]
MTATFIEGVGDEVVVGVTSTLCAVFGVLVVARFGPSNRRTVHPEREEDVRRAREHLRANGAQRHELDDNEAAADPTQQCPVCLGLLTYAVETNCGHTFCANCILTYWREGRFLAAVSCPVCRQTVTLLLPAYTTREQENTEELQSIQSQVSNYNRRYSGQPRPLLDYLYDMPTLIRHLGRELFSVSGLVWMVWVRIVMCLFAAIIYFILPVDLLPEAVFGLLGYLDDILVILLLAIYATVVYRNFIANR